jgi:hypothetical protein
MKYLSAAALSGADVFVPRFDRLLTAVASRNVRRLMLTTNSSWTSRNDFAAVWKQWTLCSVDRP